MRMILFSVELAACSVETVTLAVGSAVDGVAYAAGCCTRFMICCPFVDAPPATITVTTAEHVGIRFVVSATIVGNAPFVTPST